MFPLSISRPPFVITATLLPDYHAGPPDKIDDGFWPSHDPSSPGYVKDEDFDVEELKSINRMKAFKNHDWYYVGVVLQVHLVSLPYIPLIAPFSIALWGLESDREDYISDIVKELAEEAIEEARINLNQLKQAA